jgi:hypothetical protein
VSFKDAPVGTVRSGVVVSIEPDVQGKKYKSEERATWPSGDPKLSIVITLDTSEGRRALWVTKYKKDATFQAIKAAQDKLGRPLQEGDTLHVKYTGNEGGDPPRKLYAASIEAGKPVAKDPFAPDDEPPF